MANSTVTNGVLKGNCTAQYDKFTSVGFDALPTLTKYNAMCAYYYKNNCAGFRNG